MTFSSIADFRSATFSYVDSRWASADFRSATFSGPAHFSSATFAGLADFRSATFSAVHVNSRYNIADFGSATFSGPAHFRSATFSGTAGFSSATFSGLADFGRATFSFSHHADFSRATFSSLAYFQRATFGHVTLFVDAKMRSLTSFDDVTFSQPPQFFGAKLHEGTRWHGTTWPEPPKDTATARDYVVAYERLKLEMDRLKKHEDELNFFARELQCRQVLLGWRGLPITAYGFLCDYGRSYFRPLSFLMATVFLGTFFSVAHFVGYWTPGISDTGHTCQAIGLSFANTFGVFGINRDLIGPGVLQYLPGWLKVVSAIQTVFGIGLLFLFGLGIRNRFRMR